MAPVLCCVVWGLPEEADCARLIGGLNQQLLSACKPTAAQSAWCAQPTKQQAPLGDRQVFTSLLEQGGFDHMDLRQVESVIFVTPVLTPESPLFDPCVESIIMGALVQSPCDQALISGAGRRHLTLTLAVAVHPADTMRIP